MTDSAQKQSVIFCDFDGTITNNDNIIEIMKHFKPDGYEELVNQIITKDISIKEGVGKLFSLLPSSMEQEVIDYALNHATIRAGFQGLLDYCQANDIHFLVTSGGIDFFVYPLLKPFDIPAEHIYCNGSDFTGERIRITWPHPCDDACHTNCGMCKTTIIRSYPKDRYKRILIGDSVTDFEGAKLVDTIFARSHLIEMCEMSGMPYHPFTDFFDVIEVLKNQRG
ncbi:2-hydroxy-3-keto-5-methylthiopentenyl-1-phosphate phosphatase [Paenibacillus thalictri]|uniref:2-hydroxy-3-keto-5-methylthiopentenyl-1-phosphate phosphatase n=1 Tax=Paenibacillus thalictri TaxID=2527873 RepID=A0A4Q9DV85_9BACL|nr:2-hydroxy-3-keto-5-methylthiopentenyl-1-phosphate phosphatase [Paenibacillus thalictri]TBL79693.1 2-hydroxy-3-keto-5-methylthiopentenyl-1-phosphate phosphatase [Paenibacillus thalictri]